jgi:16S rRNA (cytosine1402-N4)-methyltransferase
MLEQAATFHLPVLLPEIVAVLNLKPNQNVIDCTLGDGGHTIEILKHTAPNGKVLGIDADEEAIQRADFRITNYGLHDRVICVNDNFRNVSSIVNEYNFFPVRAVLLDLGMSSYQLDQGNRGFSFQKDTPLSMSFQTARGVCADDIVNTYSKQKLKEILKKYGEIKRPGAIAHNIVEARKIEPIKTSSMLVTVVLPGVHRTSGGQLLTHHIKLLAKVWQAIRIEVNQELEALTSALNQIADILEPGGRVAVLSYHSLEDRIVKQFFKREENPCVCPIDFPECRCEKSARLSIITKKVIRPSEDEIKSNPRSRSAKLRGAQKL